MLGIYVSVPIACFRRGLARELLETEDIPPPATCYGFLLSLVGEVDRRRHIGARVTCTLLSCTPERSAVLRTVWRVKRKPLGAPGNTRPDYQQLLTNVSLVVWLDSTAETTGSSSLESRVSSALDPLHRRTVQRFGGLSLGESTHMVDEVRAYSPAAEQHAKTFLLAPQGRLTLPVWVDHVGSRDTLYVTGELEEADLSRLDIARVPQVNPPDRTNR